MGMLPFIAISVLAAYVVVPAVALEPVFRSCPPEECVCSVAEFTAAGGRSCSRVPLYVS